MIQPTRKKELNYYILTMGCQMNVYDSEVLAGHLENMEYSSTEEQEKADVFVINTCAVRKKAEEKVHSRLGKLKILKKEKPEMLMVLWGCMVQQGGTARKMAERFPFLDIIGGPHSLGRFPELLEKAPFSSRTIIDIEPEGEREGLPVKRGEGVSAWVPISHGCDNYCTYCIVPYVRGPEKSRLPGEIIKEITELAREGYREITLLGQNVNSYGKDLEEDIGFAQLLEVLDETGRLQRIRFMTSQPRDFSTNMVEVIAAGEKICEHFHLPLQAGSNKILQKMNRGYTKEKYLQLVHTIRKLIPECSITTDIIVGFPGETEDDFQESIEVLQQVRFDAAFTFVYSPRSGTKAAEMEDQVSLEEKKRRIVTINKVQNNISLEENLKLLGYQQEILVEGKSKTDQNIYTGRTRTNKIVHFSTEEDLTGRLVNLEIVEAKPWTLTGKLLDNNISF